MHAPRLREKNAVIRPDGRPAIQVVLQNGAARIARVISLVDLRQLLGVTEQHDTLRGGCGGDRIRQ